MIEASPEGDNYEAQLEALRQHYSAMLPDKISQIEGVWGEVLGKAWEIDSLTALRLLVHSLAGSGATFGFPQVSTLCRRMENTLKLVLEAGQSPNQEMQNEIEECLAALQSAFGEGCVVGDAEISRIAEVAPEGALAESSGTQKNIFLINFSSQTREDFIPHFERFGYSPHLHDLWQGLCPSGSATPAAAVIVELGIGADQEEEALNALLENAANISANGVPPIIVLSHSSDMDVRLKAVRAGVSAFLTFPMDIAAVIDVLDQLSATQDGQGPFRVLLVDDDPHLVDHYSVVLRRAGMKVEGVNDPMKVMECLQDFDPELILTDVYMPLCSGLELAQVLRQQDAYAGIPIVFLSTEACAEKQQGALSLGGDDFLTKPIDDTHLVAAVGNRIKRARVLRSFMVKDSLTGLLNHSRIIEQVVVEVERAKRQETAMSFAMIDLDHFKSVNDTHGHGAGDLVLVALSWLLRQRLRKVDVIGRYGGEEFAVILPDTDGAAACKVLNEIRHDFAAIVHESAQGNFSVTLSCGIATSPPHGDQGSICEAADQALYKVKEQGRNAVALA